MFLLCHTLFQKLVIQGCDTNLPGPWNAGIPMEDVETKKNVKEYIMTLLTMSWGEKKKAWWQVKSFEDYCRWNGEEIRSEQNEEGLWLLGNSKKAHIENMTGICEASWGGQSGCYSGKQW